MWEILLEIRRFPRGNIPGNMENTPGNMEVSIWKNSWKYGDFHLEIWDVVLEIWRIPYGNIPGNMEMLLHKKMWEIVLEIWEFQYGNIPGNPELLLHEEMWEIIPSIWTCLSIRKCGKYSWKYRDFNMEIFLEIWRFPYQNIP